MENINELIDINLKIIYERDKNKMFACDFLDLSGTRLTSKKSGDEFAVEMVNRNLITMNGSKCKITEFGYKIAKNGGWLNHLESEKGKQEIKNEEEEILKKMNFEKLKYEICFAKWQVKTFWYFFVFAVIGGFYSSYEILSSITRNEDEEVITNEKLNEKLKTFHDSISKVSPKSVLNKSGR